MNAPVSLVDYVPPVGGVPAAEKSHRTRKVSYRTHRVVMLDPEANVLGFVHVRAVSEPQARRAALDMLASKINIARCSEEELIEIGRQGIPVLDAESGEWIGEHVVSGAIKPASVAAALGASEAHRPVSAIGGLVGSLQPVEATVREAA